MKLQCCDGGSCQKDAKYFMIVLVRERTRFPVCEEHLKQALNMLVGSKAGRLPHIEEITDESMGNYVAEQVMEK